MPTDALKSADDVLQALRLGYLTVEAYSRLKSRIDRGRYKAPAANPERRFEFTKPNRQSQFYQILQSAGQLHAQANALNLDVPPLPKDTELKALLETGITQATLAKLHHDLDDWAQRAGLQLSLRNEEAARAFGFGGSFASTYWDGYATDDADCAKKFGSLLAAGRLRETIERLESLRHHLPPYATEALRYGMEYWSIGEKIKKRKDFDPEKTKLENQMTVWRDMLFGRRPPETFLDTRLRYRVQLQAYASTAALVIGGLFLFWMFLWTVPTLIERLDFTRWLIATFSPATQLIHAEIPLQLDGVVKAGSAFLATISSVTVFIAGVISRVSGWILRLHARMDFRYRSRAIQKRTLRAPAI